MIADPFLRWVVTILFVLSAAEMVYAMVTSHRAGAYVVSHLLHLLMAVAMAVMAWPRGAALPTTGPMIVFLVATAWFVGVVLRYRGHRLINGYHALMMLSMAWMYAVMSGDLLPGSRSGGEPGAGAAPMAGMPGMPGMSMGGSTDGDSPMAQPGYVDVLNWVCTIGFALATLWWLYRYFGQRKAEPAQPAHRFLGDASQAMMAVGMAVMFGVLL
ncbi:hypothetical protein MMAD_11870 [Mycolicibacterium madagascariense]|uniref:DUF5134 domain-containing protein n=1 Tax=Mycolicibacterium madagascariense TaxID=212765 RepID=A0A7I7XBT1_9MYCO|nr:DUF5134 domain-containing protein [Mycolicibacterium madagascariense]MCV7014983.1 DUF5134 domain-containing protein [Mycolicibacterium madagascariense]BBZ26892.1 hypothetical protein MMAD_11870 [Mycolicibacterium madagascariense]